MARHEAPQNSGIPQGAEQYNPSVYQAPRQDAWERRRHTIAEEESTIEQTTRTPRRSYGRVALAAATAVTITAGAVWAGVASARGGDRVSAENTGGSDRENSAAPAPGYEQNPLPLDNQEAVDTDPETLDPQYWQRAEYTVGGETYQGYDALFDAKSLKTGNYTITPDNVFLDAEAREAGEVGGGAMVARDFFNSLNDQITTLTEPGAEQKWARFGQPDNPEQDRRELAVYDVITPAYSEMLGDDTGLTKNVQDLHLGNLDGAGYRFLPRTESVSGAADFYKGIDDNIKQPEKVPLELQTYITVDMEKNGVVTNTRNYKLLFKPVEVDRPDGTTEEVYKLQDASWTNVDK